MQQDKDIKSPLLKYDGTGSNYGKSPSYSEKGSRRGTQSLKKDYNTREDVRVYPSLGEYQGQEQYNAGAATYNGSGGKSYSTPSAEEFRANSRVNSNPYLDQKDQEEEEQNVVYILKEPSTCITIPSLEQEKEKTDLTGLPMEDEPSLSQSSSIKPQDIYLIHCQNFSQNSLDRVPIDVKPYAFQPGDFQSGVLNMNLINRMFKDGAFYGPNETHEDKEDQEKAECFQTEEDSMRVFTDFVHWKGKIYMVLKTWQKVIFQTRQQRLTFGDINENQQRKFDIIKSQTADKESINNGGRLGIAKSLTSTEMQPFMKNEFYIKTIQIFSSKGKPLTEPILVEHVFGSFESMRLYDTSFLQFESKLYFFQRIYEDVDYNSDIEEDYNTLNVQQEDNRESDNASQNQVQGTTSTYSRRRQTQQMPKYTNEKERQRARKAEDQRIKQDKKDKKFLDMIKSQQSTLQLFSLDLEDMVLDPVDGYCIDEAILANNYIDEPEVAASQQRDKRKGPMKAQPGVVAGMTLKEVSEMRPQYCITFSQEFGNDLLDDYPHFDWDHKEENFLASQFICVQKYFKKKAIVKEKDSGFAQEEQVRIYRLDNYQQVSFDYSLCFDSDDARQFENDKLQTVDMQRQIQFCNHIRDYKKRHGSQKASGSEETDGEVNFLVSNMRGLLEIQVSSKGDTNLVRNWPRDQKHVFQKIWNNGGIVPQRHFVQLGNTDEQNCKYIEQYYFVDSKNQIQLIYPRRESKVETLKIIEIIQEERNIIQRDFKHYKKIHCIFTTPPEAYLAGFPGQYPAETDPNFLRVKDLDNDKNPEQIYYQQVVQKIRDLKAVLAYQDIKKEMCFTFLKDSDCQTLVVTEPSSQRLYLFKMQDHNCENCKMTHDPQYQKRLQENSIAHLQKKNNNTLNTMLNTKEDCEQGLKKNATLQRQDMPREADNSDELCKHCGDEHEDAYTVFEPMNEDGSINPSNMRLTTEEKKNHVLIDDFGGQKHRVKTYELEYADASRPMQQIRLELYQRSEQKHAQQEASHAIFVFSVYNAEYDGTVSDDISNIMVRKSYIFVQKTYQEMKEIFASQCQQVVIKAEDKVRILKDYSHLEKIQFNHIRDYQFANDFKVDDDDKDQRTNLFKDEKYPFAPIKLTLCKVNDDKCKINFVPIIYQVQQNPDQNRILIYDIIKGEITQKLSISPSPENLQHLYEDDQGYNKFMICRTSDLYEENHTKAQSARYQMFMLYTEKIGRLFCEEFYIQQKPGGAKVQTIGQKHIILSKKVIQDYDWRHISESVAFPFSDIYGSIKGCQIMLKTDEKQYTVIALQDQDVNNLYTHKSTIILTGQKKFIFNPQQPESYVLVISTMIRRKLILQNILNRYEAFVVLKQALDTVMSMRIPDLEYLSLNTFDVQKKKDFFRPQEILLGKSICDICLSEPQSILAALEDWKNLKSESQRAWGSIIEQLTWDDRIRRETFIETKFYPKSLVINLDLDFTGTIARAMAAQNTKSLKMILEQVMESSDAYKLILMFDLTRVLQSNQIQINDFFAVTPSEKMQFSASLNENSGIAHKMCNLEVDMKHPDLPVFAKKDFDYFTINEFEHFMNVETDILAKIQEFNPANQNDTQDQDDITNTMQEVEYSYIDFTWTMIGEKIRPTDKESKKRIKFDDYYFSGLIDSQYHKKSFFACDTVKSMIDSQWDTTQYVQTKIFTIYFTLFVIPMCVSSFKITPFVDTLMFQIAIIPGVMLFGIECIQFYYQGRSYFDMGWNTIDLAQLIVYCVLLVLRYRDVNNTALYYPELKLVNILLAFLKTMYFMRIFQKFGFLVQMIQQCLIAIIPFCINYIVFLFVFSICFVILGMEIDPEVDEAQALSYFAKTFLQTFRTSIGELGMPVYKKLLKRKGIFKGINVALIWVVWFSQTFFMLVVMLNFLIAVITSNYEKVYNSQAVIAYLHKASLNYETYMLLNCFKDLPEYRCFVFQKSRLNDTSKDEMDKRFDDLKKFISKRNQQLMSKNEKMGQKIDKILDIQREMDKDMRKQFSDLQRNQVDFHEEIIFKLNKAQMPVGTPRQELSDQAPLKQ